MVSRLRAPAAGIGIAAGLGGGVDAYAGAGLQSRVPESALRWMLGWLALPAGHNA
jgi:uncharacterized membrane protein YfcA